MLVLAGVRVHSEVILHVAAESSGRSEIITANCDAATQDLALRSERHDDDRHVTLRPAFVMMRGTIQRAVFRRIG